MSYASPYTDPVSSEFSSSREKFISVLKDVYDADVSIHFGGFVARMFFENGYGASVVSHNFSYGGDQGFWEIAVLDKDGELCYDTSVTSDVIGWLDEDGVLKTLKQIEALKAENYRFNAE